MIGDDVLAFLDFSSPPYPSSRPCLQVRETLQDVPGKVEEFLGLLYEFEQGGEGRSVVELFTQLRGVLADQTELLRDFAAFLLPDQALECGLVGSMSSWLSVSSSPVAFMAPEIGRAHV